MPSFDVVSELNWGEVDNAMNQAKKELSQRYDFRGTDASVERTDDGGLVVRANVDDRVEAALAVLEEKLVRRKVSLTHLAPGKPEPGPKNTRKIVIKVAEGIDRDKGKELVHVIKDGKLKVQATIQDDIVRVTGKKKDDLQAAMSLLRNAELGIELQFKNFRD